MKLYQHLNVCGNACPGSKMAATLPAKLRARKSGYASLVALLTPGTLFALGLWWFGDRLGVLSSQQHFPWQLWIITLSGIIATCAGIGDWVYHRWMAKCVVPRKERNCELLALAGGGVPLFLLMGAASISDEPKNYLIPVIVVVLFVVVLICYDEFIFHRHRCRRFETVLHRLLVFGNGTAWLAWAHWCFVKGGIHG